MSRSALTARSTRPRTDAGSGGSRSRASRKTETGRAAVGRPFLFDSEMHRCAWVPEGDPLYVVYHDEEWGVPSRDVRHLFEHLVLEGAQAGLSWSTILHRREGYRAAFAKFDPKRVAGLDPAALLADARIIRNRLKVESAIANARTWLEQDDPVELLWSFVGGEPVVNRWRTLAEIPAETPESTAMSKELKRRGF